MRNVFFYFFLQFFINILKTVPRNSAIQVLFAVYLARAQTHHISLGLLDVFLGNFLLATQRDVDLDVRIFRLLDHLLGISFNEGFLLLGVLLIVIFCIRPHNRYPIGFGRWRVIPPVNIFLLIETPNGLIVIKYLSEISELGVNLVVLVFGPLRDAQYLLVFRQQIIACHQNASFRLEF